MGVERRGWAMNRLRGENGRDVCHCFQDIHSMISTVDLTWNNWLTGCSTAEEHGGKTTKQRIFGSTDGLRTVASTSWWSRSANENNRSDIASKIRCSDFEGERLRRTVPTYDRVNDALHSVVVDTNLCSIFSDSLPCLSTPHRRHYFASSRQR